MTLWSSLCSMKPASKTGVQKTPSPCSNGLKHAEEVPLLTRLYRDHSDGQSPTVCQDLIQRCAPGSSCSMGPDPTCPASVRGAVVRVGRLEALLHLLQQLPDFVIQPLREFGGQLRRENPPNVRATPAGCGGAASVTTALGATRPGHIPTAGAHPQSPSPSPAHPPGRVEVAGGQGLVVVRVGVREGSLRHHCPARLGSARPGRGSAPEGAAAAARSGAGSGPRLPPALRGSGSLCGSELVAARCVCSRKPRGAEEQLRASCSVSSKGRLQLARCCWVCVL